MFGQKWNINGEMQIEYQLNFCHSTIVMLEGKLLKGWLEYSIYTHTI